MGQEDEREGKERGSRGSGDMKERGRDERRGEMGKEGVPLIF